MAEDEENNEQSAQDLIDDAPDEEVQTLQENKAKREEELKEISSKLREANVQTDKNLLEEKMRNAGSDEERKALIQAHEGSLMEREEYKSKKMDTEKSLRENQTKLQKVNSMKQQRKAKAEGLEKQKRAKATSFAQNVAENLNPKIRKEKNIAFNKEINEAQAKVNAARGPSAGTQLRRGVAGYGTAVGSMFGFTRYGVAGKAIEQEEIARKKAKVEKKKELIDGLTSLRESKKKKYMQDGIINSKEKNDLDRLMKQIQGYQQQNKSATKALESAQDEQKFNQSFKYLNTETGKFIENQKGGTRGYSRGTKGDKEKKEGTGNFRTNFGGVFTNKMQMSPKFNKVLQNAINNPMGFAEKQAIQPVAKMTAEQEAMAPKRNKLGLKVTRKNELGVEDWVLDM